MARASAGAGVGLAVTAQVSWRACARRSASVWIASANASMTPAGYASPDGPDAHPCPGDRRGASGPGPRSPALRNASTREPRMRAARRRGVGGLRRSAAESACAQAGRPPADRTPGALRRQLPINDPARAARQGALGRHFGAMFGVSDDRCDLLCLDRPIIALALRDGEELCVCDLAWITERAENLVSHHARALRAAGLASSRRRGKMVLCSLTRRGHELLGVVAATEARA